MGMEVSVSCWQCFISLSLRGPCAPSQGPGRLRPCACNTRAVSRCFVEMLPRASVHTSHLGALKCRPIHSILGGAEIPHFYKF